MYTTFYVMVTVIKQNDKNILRHYKGVHKVRSCQCSKDCDCTSESWEYDFYTVHRIGKKTTKHNTLEEAEVRWNVVNNLNQ